MSSSRPRVAIAGASGYAGGELLRLVSAHPELDVVAVTAHGQAGQAVGAVHPNLQSVAELVFAETTPQAVADADIVFTALPHGAAQALVEGLAPGQRVVDLGSEYRITDEAVYLKYYGGPFLGAWTYGLPELPGQRDLIAAASRVANTGCHAVAAILGLAPLVAAGVVAADDVVVVSASGTSGAGKSPLPHLLGSEVMGDVSAYKVGAHRHVAEIKQAAAISSLSMIPVLAPMPRGILASSAAKFVPGKVVADARSALADAYCREPFVHLLPAGVQPHTAATAGSNSAHLQVELDTDSGRLLITCALDNLGKGAAGQALQNANIMLGLPETLGLATDGIAP
jgi:N-acetyl-gamma-glutamyl-phosphate reductase